MRRWAMAAAVMLAVPLTAGAQAAPFHLRWSGPINCPDEAQVARDTQRLLGGSTAAPRDAPIEADAQVTGAAGGFELVLRVGSTEQTRTRKLAAPSCDELARAAALVVALAVDPSLSLAEADQPKSSQSAPGLTCPEPATVVSPPICPVCASCTSPPAIPKPNADATWRSALVAGTSVAYGELPQLLPRPNLGLAYRADAFWFELSAGAAFASSRRLSGGRVATFSQWYAAPRFCVQSELGWARVGGCAVAELGSVRASGFGVEFPKTQRDWWVAPGVGLQLSRRMTSGAELFLGADALLAAVRPRFELALQPLFRPHLIIPALRLGLIGGLF